MATEENKVGYKITKLGLIPKDWEFKELEKLGSFSKGKGISKSDLIEEGIPCVRYGEIYTHHDYVIKKFYSFIDNKVADESKEIKKNDILFAGSGETPEDIGKCIAYLSDEKAYAGGDVIILSPNNIDSIFLSYSLNSNLLIKQKYKLGQGHSVVHIYPRDLGKLLIPLPPLPEQKKIAKILSTWDDAIATTEKLIAAKEELKKGLMQKLLTGKKRFKEFEGEEWREKHLIDICEKIQDGNYGGDYPKPEEFLKQGIPFLTSKSIGDNNYISSENINYISSEKHRLLKKAHIKKEDIIFTNRGANVGSVAIVPNELDNGNIGPQLTLLRCKKEKVLNTFLFNFMQCWLFKKQILMQDAGSAMNFFGINSTSKFKILVPSLKEQKRIASLLSTCDKEIKILKEKLKALQKQKKGLMQQLLTGKVRVKIDSQAEK